MSPSVPDLALNNLRDNPGARRNVRRVGRGRGGGRGKTSGRGQKGQKARSSISLGFEGGQTPLHKRLPKMYPKKDPLAREFAITTLGRIQRWVDTERLVERNDEGLVKVGMGELWRSKAVRKVYDGVRVICGFFDGLSVKLDLQVTEIEPDAARMVLDAGGKVTIVYYDRVGLRALLKPHKWLDQGLPIPRFARPPPKLMFRYPDRSENGLPIRRIVTSDDIAMLDLKRPTAYRAPKKLII